MLKLQMLIKEIKDLNKQRHIDWKIHFSQTDQQMYRKSYQIPGKILVDIGKFILNTF